MQAELLVLCLGALCCVPIIWVVPRAYAPDAVALFTALVLSSMSLPSAAWLVGSACLTHGALRLSRRIRRPGAVLAPVGLILVAVFLVGRERPAWQLVGMAYVTLRNLHLLVEGWMGSDELPANLREMLRYHLFLPVLGVGPIHRFPSFRRSLRTRRFEPSELARGAERALFGMATATVLGTAVMAKAQAQLLPLLSSLPAFWADFAASVLDWVQLYLVFAGLSGFAIGAALMMGLRVEENFNRPFAATSLLDFWSRWHISLTTWCRDYVFQPVTAATRRPLIGLTAAMVVVGLWHETSVYYLLWSAWQVLGIVLNRLAIRLMDRRGLSVPVPVLRLAAPVLILGWLALARPAITRFLEAL